MPGAIMTHWRDLAVLTSEEIVFIKFMHVMGGVYIWEFSSNLGYEYSIIMGERKFTWTFPLYLGCRWCPLFCIILQFIGSDAAHKISCNAWMIATFVFGYLSFAFASALIVLRVVALWDHNKIATTLATVTWLANTGMCIYSATIASAVWHGNICMALRTEHGEIGILSTLISDFVLLMLMLFGLLRWKGTQERGGIWWFLYTQGLAWVVLVTLAEVPPAVFIILDLNDPLNLMFQVLAMVIVAIGASRIYRGLVDHPSFSHRDAQASSKCWDELQPEAREVKDGDIV